MGDLDPLTEVPGKRATSRLKKGPETNRCRAPHRLQLPQVVQVRHVVSRENEVLRREFLVDGAEPADFFPAETQKPQRAHVFMSLKKVDSDWFAVMFISVLLFLDFLARFL